MEFSQIEISVSPAAIRQAYDVSLLRKQLDMAKEVTAKLYSSIGGDAYIPSSGASTRATYGKNGTAG